MNKASIATISILLFSLFLIFLATLNLILLGVLFFSIAIIIYKTGKSKTSQNTSPEIIHDSKSKPVNDKPATDDVPTSTKDNYAIFHKSDEILSDVSSDKNLTISELEEKIKLQYDKQGKTEQDESKDIPKKYFNRNQWTFKPNESIKSKKRKFLNAIEYCTIHDLTSKAKLRRLKMKIKKWDLQNSRDLDALLPDYNHLIDLMEKFDTLNKTPDSN